MNKTAQEVVEYLNYKLHGVDAEHEDNHFTYCATGMFELIVVYVYVEDIEIKISIWNSEADNREFNEELNEYEPLEDYIIKTYDDCLERLQRIRELLK